MRCPNCEAEVPAGEKFCPQCGVPVDAAQKCPHCGAVLLPGERFCGECGREVTQVVPPKLEPSVAAPLPGALPKKKSPWVWVLIVVGGLLVLACLILCSIFVIVPALMPTPTPTATATFTPTPLPTATFTPEPTPVPSLEVGELLYEQDFSNPDDEWEISESEDVVYSLDNETYSVNVLKANWMAWNLAGPDVTNFVLEMDAALLEGNKYNAYGVFFVYKDKSNRYELDINGNGSFTLGKKVNGEWTEIVDWTPHEAINGTGQINHIRLMRHQDTFTLYVNDELVYEFTDDALVSGFIAPLVTAYDNPPALAIFDNIKIWEVVSK